MVTARIGLVGFGQLGRTLFRMLAQHSDMEIVAISDSGDTAALANLLKYDTQLGRFDGSVTAAGDLLTAGKAQAQVLRGSSPSELAWRDRQVNVIIDVSGRSITHKQAAGYLEQGVKRVILCTPCADADINVTFGVNHQKITPSHKIIANGSPVTYAAAPLICTLHSVFGLQQVFYTAIQAYGADQSLSDVPASDLRRSRAAAENIVPLDEPGQESIAALVPDFQGKVAGMALNVPVSMGAMLDMVAFTEKPLTVQAVNDAFDHAASGHFKGLLDYSRDPIVSSDVKNSVYSCTYDSQATMVLGSHGVKAIGWFEHGWAYAHRTVELLAHVVQQGGLS